MHAEIAEERQVRTENSGTTAKANYSKDLTCIFLRFLRVFFWSFALKKCSLTYMHSRQPRTNAIPL